MRGGISYALRASEKYVIIALYVGDLFESDQIFKAHNRFYEDILEKKIGVSRLSPNRNV